MAFIPYIPIGPRSQSLFSALYFYHDSVSGLFDETTRRTIRADDWMTFTWLDTEAGRSPRAGPE